jgi:hypothetical protein
MTHLSQTAVPDEFVMSKIHMVRNQKVMLDYDLADLYNVETKVLNQSVKRNRDRFPDDFMFQLTREEWEFLRSQFVTLETGKGKHSKYLPFAFTEQGVAMLSGVLNSPTAILVHIQIIRVFAKMHQLLLTHKDILLQLEKIEKKMIGYDQDIALIFNYLKQLLHPPNPPRARIGFK